PEWEIDFQDNVFVLSGRAVERLSRLSLEERDAQEYLYERLEALGVMAELRRRGLREGSAIRLGEYELVYSEK
ncbi:Obg family GTPase CgtA, partial [Candidatus Acetothermia bacterium]|nr:Obg family GTPase CgtA [Candidatus Acetothermia bacterium]